MATTLEKYSIVKNPTGYYNKREITDMDPRSLVVGSKNMRINDADKVVTRNGYTLDGAARTVTKGIDSSYDWESTTGLIVLRSYLGATANTGKLQVRTTDSTGAVSYVDLLTGLSTADFNMSVWWNTTENQDNLLMVDGTYNIRSWSGAVATVASNTATTITLQGTDTFAQKRFQTALAGRAVIVPGVGTYTYTGGETTTTLTGLVGVPAIPVGTVIFQAVVDNTTLTSVPTNFTPDTIDTQSNQVWIGSTVSHEVYVSKATSFTDFSYTSPMRLPTDGWKMTFDSPIVGFIQDNDVMYVIAGTSDFYKVERQYTADGQGETFKFRKLRSAPGQAAISQKAIIPVKNGVIFISNEKAIDWLTSVENINTQQSLPISDPIKNDFDSYDITGATGKYFQNELWIALPAENLVRVYDFDKALWNPPYTIPVSSFSIIDNVLYGHSNTSNETYKLNDGLTDNGVAIDYVAAFAYRQYNDRSVLKNFDQYYSEIYMPTSNVVTVSHYFEYKGADGIIEKTITGTDTGLQFTPVYDSSLGKNTLGSNPLGSTSSDVDTLVKYRCVHDMVKQDFFEHQVVFSSNGQFEILAHGPNIQMSTNIPKSITR